MRIIPKIGKLFKRPYPKGSMREKMTKTMKGAGKYIAMGGALSLGAEGISALVNHARSPSPSNMQDSEKVEFQDWGPSIFRVDSVETAPRSKLPLSLITCLLVTLGIFFCLCLPFFRIMSALVRHCRLNRALKISSPICPPPFGPPTIHDNTTSSPEDPDSPPLSMESVWKSMNETKLEVEEAKQEAEETRLKIEEEIIAREKADIGDVVQRIRDSVAVKAAERLRQEREQNEED